MQRIALLKRLGVVPVIVFDGGRLVMKTLEEGSRAKCGLASSVARLAAVPGMLLAVDQGAVWF